MSAASLSSASNSAVGARPKPPRTCTSRSRRSIRRSSVSISKFEKSPRDSSLTAERRAFSIFSGRVGLYRLAIPLFTIWVYWSGLRAWFVSDDWVWLGLLNDVHGLQDLWPAIFRPTIHGTIRPWSDRVFFLVFRSLFDLDGFPYHAWIVATQIAAALLLMSIMRRLTGSKPAAF